MASTEEQDPPAAASSDPSPPSVAAPIPSTTLATGTAAALRVASASAGFDHLFTNDIALARTAFAADAALGMESRLMGEASRLLALSEAGAKKAAAESHKTNNSNTSSGRDGGGRFAPGLE
ncbi:hypothetical protein B0H14DRAFT_3866384 [Mycena olivaceomarginata]|nr:hypothetical protein B0H14DRAFT_3866384 [Mycena olivaceomarginata]